MDVDSAYNTQTRHMGLPWTADQARGGERGVNVGHMECLPYDIHGVFRTRS